MERNNQNPTGNNKNSLPQTPKTQKTATKSNTSTTRKEEFSREFTEIINKTLKQKGNGTNERNNNKR